MAVAYKDQYVEMDEKYQGKTYLMAANTLMTWPSDIDASRLYMNTAETKQSLTLLNPDVPRLSNGWENVMGRLNKDRSYKLLEGTWEVKDIIQKFSSGFIFTVVLYNKEKDLYDMIEKPMAENLIEKFGYVYNTERLDKLKVGDVITDEVLYKSTAYDDHMNYRYGKNAKVLYSTSTNTLEDAVQIRQGWADGVESVEVDTITVPINTNHAPLNIYGDDTNYQSCPEFGQYIKDSTPFAVRPINNAHILTDFRNDNLRKIFSTDFDYAIAESKFSYIYDINICYNSPDPFPDNIFFRQLKGYYDEILQYSERMLEWATKIKESGSNYTDNIPFFRSKYMHVNDPEWQFCGKEKNKPFGNMVVEFRIISVLGIVPGSKIAGRYGDKGVIAKVSGSGSRLQEGTMDSILDMLGRPATEEEREKLASQIRIVPDSEMYYTDDFPVDIILNASGAIRRLNPGQIDEVDINFQGEAIRKKLLTLETMEEKEELVFEFMSMLNQEQCDFFYEMYQSFDQKLQIKDHALVLSNQKEKERFIRNIEEHGFYIRKDIDASLRYETIKKIYERFDFIKPLPLYIDIFGTKKRRCIKDGIVADKYMFILKHNSNKNFSARSTFRVSRANLPVKDTTKRDNRSQYSKSPVRIGEAYNLMPAISGALLAEYNIYMRSSTLGKKALKYIIETDGNPLEIKRLEVKDNYINTNADIFNARLKGIGLGTEFEKADTKYSEMLEDVVMPLHIGKFTIYDTPLKREFYNQLFVKYLIRMEEFTMMESYVGEKSDKVWDEIFKEMEKNSLDSLRSDEYGLSDDMKEMLKKATRNKGGRL